MRSKCRGSMSTCVDVLKRCALSPCSAWFGYDHFHASLSVIDIGIGQLLGNDIAKVISAKVKLLSALATSLTMFGVTSVPPIRQSWTDDIRFCKVGGRRNAWGTWLILLLGLEDYRPIGDCAEITLQQRP